MVGLYICLDWLHEVDWEMDTKTYRVANCKIEGSMTPLPSFVFAYKFVDREMESRLESKYE